MFTYACPAGHRADALGKLGDLSRPCPECGRPAAKVSVYATAIGGRARTPVSERPVSLRQYREATEQLAYEHDRAEESAQRSLPTPPLADMAIKRAKRLERAGITDSLDYRPEYVRD